MRSLCTSALVALLVAGPLAAATKHTNGKIAFGSLRDGNAEIYVMNQDGSSQTRLTVDPGTDSQAAWSPNGKQIVFVRDGDIFVMNADGTGQTSLTSGNFTNNGPQWSPDGKRIAFESNRSGN